jgi:phage tail-like protein
MPDTRGPIRTNRFIVEIDGLAAAGFRRVDLPGQETREARYREGNDKRPTERSLTGGLNGGADLILERGAKRDDTILSDWYRLVEAGKLNEARRAVAVVIMDEEGATGPRYEFSQAWPKRYEPPTLDAQAGNVGTETLVVTYERMERVA